jgi:hypothetical protein
MSLAFTLQNSVPYSKVGSINTLVLLCFLRSYNLYVPAILHFPLGYHIYMSILALLFKTLLNVCVM